MYNVLTTLPQLTARGFCTTSAAEGVPVHTHCPNIPLQPTTTMTVMR